MYFHALLLLSRIWEIHGLLKDGDVIEADRLGAEFDEDRQLLHTLTLDVQDREAALAHPSPALRRSLLRLRESALIELTTEESSRSNQIATTTQETGRALLTIGACEALLESAA